MKKLFSLLLAVVLILPMGACAQEGGGNMANYLTFASAEPFAISVSKATKNWDGTLYYSTDATSWNEWDGTTTISSGKHNGKQKIYMRGSGNSVITGTAYGKLSLSGNNICCIGNIETLLDYETVANGKHPVMGNNCFTNLFNGCTGLIAAPELPATTLSNGCYSSMFRGSGITSAPVLPATVLTRSCYASMFQDCESLVTAPALPATNLPESCYSWMFSRCNSLVTLPELPATTLYTSSYGSMFADCTSIKLSRTQTDEYITAYKIPANGRATTELTNPVISNMFSGTGGTYTGNDWGQFYLNATYYTSNKVVGVSKLSISTDNATENTATFTFSCKNLNTTDTVYRIKAWCYPYGMDYWTAPATWESDLFAGPTHSESVTFTGLLPGVEYEVYAVIYGTDGATEHNAVTTFTTAASEEETPQAVVLCNELMATSFTAHLFTQGLKDGKEYTAEFTLRPKEFNSEIPGVVEKIVTFTGEAAFRAHSCEFTDLLPNTTYTVNVDLYPSDGSESIIACDCEVTTLDGEIPDVPVVGFNQDSFLLGFASGLGCTAATKDGVEYNAWTQGYIVGSALRKAL